MCFYLWRKTAENDSLRLGSDSVFLKDGFSFHCLVRRNIFAVQCVDTTYVKLQKMVPYVLGRILFLAKMA